MVTRVKTRDDKLDVAESKESNAIIMTYLRHFSIVVGCNRFTMRPMTSDEKSYIWSQLIRNIFIYLSCLYNCSLRISLYFPVFLFQYIDRFTRRNEGKK